jgi:hypothetical protein
MEHRVRLLPTPATQALVVIAAVVGLFAMHGLGDHGVSHQGDHGVLDASMPAAAHAVHGAHRQTSELSPSGGTSSLTGDLGSRDLGLAGACLAVVGLVGLARCLMVSASRTSPPSSCPSRTTRAFAGVVVRTADPPDRHQLQVHRC